MKRKAGMRLLASALSAALALCLTACGAPTDEPPPEMPGQSAEETAPPEALEQGTDQPLTPEEAVGIGEWLPPTDTGLADTTWATEDDWILELKSGGADASYAGEALLYCRTMDDGDAVLLYTGGWSVENDSLRLDLTAADGSESRGAYPVLISPSGEGLRVEQGADGVHPPFFADGVTSLDMTYCYG